MRCMLCVCARAETIPKKGKRKEFKLKLTVHFEIRDRRWWLVPPRRRRIIISRRIYEESNNRLYCFFRVFILFLIFLSFLGFFSSFFFFFFFFLKKENERRQTCNGGFGVRRQQQGRWIQVRGVPLSRTQTYIGGSWVSWHLVSLSFNAFAVGTG